MLSAVLPMDREPGPESTYRSMKKMVGHDKSLCSALMKTLPSINEKPIFYTETKAARVASWFSEKARVLFAEASSTS